MLLFKCSQVWLVTYSQAGSHFLTCSLTIGTARFSRFALDLAIFLRSPGFSLAENLKSLGTRSLLHMHVLTS